MEKFIRAIPDKSTPEKDRYRQMMFSQPAMSTTSSTSQRLDYSPNSASQWKASFEPKYNKQRVEISKPMLDGPVNDRAFLVHGKYTVGAKRSEKAAHTAKHRSVKNIVAAVLDAGII